MKIMAFTNIVLASMLSTSCNYLSKEQDEFYYSKGETDLRRIPLIKPYVIQDTYTNFWLIDYFYYDKKRPWNDRQKVDYFSIVDSAIIIGCNNCIWDGEEHKNVYTVIIPKHHIEKTFTDKKAFTEYLVKSNIQPSRKFQPTETYLNWEKGKPLPWPKIDTSYEAK